MKNSKSARDAARNIESPCVVILSVNRHANTFEARCYGENPRWRQMAGMMADAALWGVDNSEPKVHHEPG